MRPLSTYVPGISEFLGYTPGNVEKKPEDIGGFVKEWTYIRADLLGAFSNYQLEPEFKYIQYAGRVSKNDNLEYERVKQDCRQNINSIKDEAKKKAAVQAFENVSRDRVWETLNGLPGLDIHVYPCCI